MTIFTRIRFPILFFLLMGAGGFLCTPATAQLEDGFSGREATPIRLNFIRPALLSPNGKTPPYEWAAAYLTNAFAPLGEERPTFLKDSTFCSTGIANSQDFEEQTQAFYTYTAEGALQEIRFEKIQAGGSFQNFSRKRYAYENGLQSRYLYQLFDAVEQAWKDDYQEVATYNESGQLIEYLIQETDGTGTWVNLERISVGYDAAGNAEAITGFVWENEAWLEDFRQLSTFNEDGDFTEIVLQDWDGADWQPLSRERAAYGPGGYHWLNYQLEIADESDGLLKPFIREQYFYNDYGFWIGTEVQMADSVTGEFNNLYRERYGYNRRGIWTSWLQQIWEDSAWVNTIRQRFEGTPKNRMEVMEVYEASTDSWISAFRNFTQFDDNRNLVRIAGTQFFNPISNQWVNQPGTRQCQHFYSEASASTSRREEIPSLECTLLNPYRTNSPILCLGMEPGQPYVLDLRDMQGRTVLNQPVRGGQAFSMDAQVSEGVYMMTLRQQGRLRHLQKILVR